jgi:hypothetical protein
MSGGREVVICLVVRRFRCLSPERAKSTFAEQVGGLTSRHARRTRRRPLLEAVALALGGQAGARLLDAPGHADFSEDTHRVLEAVDCAIMLLDSAKGLEPQTLKLFDVWARWRDRRLPWPDGADYRRIHRLHPHSRRCGPGPRDALPAPGHAY